MLTSSKPKGTWQGYCVSCSQYTDENATGVIAEPNPSLLHKRNRVIPYLSLRQGRAVARLLDRDAGRGEWKKQRPFCNEMDKGHSLHESELTSTWSLITRKLDKPLQKESR